MIPKLSKGGVAQTDRYRTASGRLRVGPVELGFFLHTGQATGSEPDDRDRNGNGSIDFEGGSITESERSNGIIYLGIGPFKIGLDSEENRQKLQNNLVHDGLTGGTNGSEYPWILRTYRSPRFVFQFGGF